MAIKILSKTKQNNNNNNKKNRPRWIYYRILSDVQRKSVVWCFTFFCFGGGLLPSSQINHTWRLILSCECPVLVWLVFRQLSLTEIIQTTFCFWAFSFSYFCIPYFHSYSMAGCVAKWLGPSLLLLLFFCSFSSSSFLHPFIFSACQPHLPSLVPHYWPFSSLLRPSGVLDRHKNTAS